MGGSKMINMKDLIKQQTNMIRKESGMKLTELKPPSGKPKVGDYLRDGNTLFAKIIEIRKDEVITNNMSGKWSKNVTKIAFKLKKLKDSGKRNVGRPIWVPK
jgi:predicted N-formylglutamate amidohydrolase